MKINSVSTSKVINLYNEVKRKNEKQSVYEIKDSIQISALGKNLSAYSISNCNYNCSSSKIESIKKGIIDGTYKVDSHAAAQKMLNIMKGRDI